MVVSKANSNGKSDTDIFRAGDIVPPYSKKSNQEDNSRQAKGGSKNTSLPQQKREIPRFDLAEEILAEQRKITAIRRKAPSPTREAGASKKDEPLGKDPALREPKQGPEKQVRSIDYAIEQPTPMLSEKQQIIAEIVARDIEGLCSGIASADSF